MYQLYITKGEYEPWWFFDDWKTMIVKERSFTNLNEARETYKQIVREWTQTYPNQKSKNPYLTAFWDEEEIAYCESCSDDIQIYHGIMILKDDSILKES